MNNLDTDVLQNTQQSFTWIYFWLCPALSVWQCYISKHTADSSWVFHSFKPPQFQIIVSCFPGMLYLKINQSPYSLFAGCNTLSWTSKLHQVNSTNNCLLVDVLWWLSNYCTPLQVVYKKCGNIVLMHLGVYISGNQSCPFSVFLMHSLCSHLGHTLFWVTLYFEGHI